MRLSLVEYLLPLALISLSTPTTAKPVTYIIEKVPAGTYPKAGKPSGLQPLTVGGVYICTDLNFSGTCGYAVQPLNTCIQLTSPWYHTITSFGPDEGTVCSVYFDRNCGNQLEYGIKYPGESQLGFDNDLIGSFRCAAET